MKGKRNCTMFETIVSSCSTQKRSSIRVESTALQRTIFIELFTGHHYSFSLLLPRRDSARRYRIEHNSGWWMEKNRDRPNIFEAGRQLTMRIPIRAKVSLFPLWGRKKIVETSEKYRKKKKKQNGKGEKVIFATRCILGGKFPREIKGKRRLINRGRGFNYCLQKWFGRRIVESFIDDGSPATGFFPRNRGLAESLDCCQLKGTLSLSLSLFLELEGLIGLIFLKNEASARFFLPTKTLFLPGEKLLPTPPPRSTLHFIR